MKPVIINAEREAYSISYVRTMTVSELMSYLEQFDDDAPVYLSHDRGYTFGGIREDCFQEDYDEEEGEI